MADSGQIQATGGDMIQGNSIGIQNSWRPGGTQDTGKLRPSVTAGPHGGPSVDEGVREGPAGPDGA